MKKKKKLWQGRSSSNTSIIAEKISESISFDKKMAHEDIQLNIAYAKMLAKQKIITSKAEKNILNALNKIKKEIENGSFQFFVSLEDIHTHIENRLTELVGDDGKKIHTGRSRNDQVATDTHLYLYKHIKRQTKYLMILLEQILNQARDNIDTIWAGYTHLQIAQPISLAHYLLAWFWKFKRDLDLLMFCSNETDCLALTSAALAGANYPLDEKFLQKELGFSKSYENSLDAISNRDYQLSYHFFASRLFIHISRLCEDLIIYSSTEFCYVSFTDKITTGSSIMPQKKNPDIAEILRGRSGNIIGNLNSLLINLKSLPLAYNRDLQDDKLYLFSTIDSVTLGLQGISEVIDNTIFHPNKVEHALQWGYAAATDLADHLVHGHKVPFREAHHQVAALVSYCEKQKKTLSMLTNEEIKKFIGISLEKNFFDLKKSLQRKKTHNPTAPSKVKLQIKKAEKNLTLLKK